MDCQRTEDSRHSSKEDKGLLNTLSGRTILKQRNSEQQDNTPLFSNLMNLII